MPADTDESPPDPVAYAELVRQVFGPLEVELVRRNLVPASEARHRAVNKDLFGGA